MFSLVIRVVVSHMSDANNCKYAECVIKSNFFFLPVCNEEKGRDSRIIIFNHKKSLLDVILLWDSFDS